MRDKNEGRKCFFGGNRYGRQGVVGSKNRVGVTSSTITISTR